MKKIAKLATVLFTGILMSAPTFATQLPTEVISVTENQPYLLEGVEIEYQGDILDAQKSTRKVIFNGSADLVTSKYQNVTNGTNWFWKTFDITNHADNDGAVLIKILNKRGEAVMETSQGIRPGTTKSYSIPATWDGEYTIQGKAVSSNGDYKLYITD